MGLILYSDKFESVFRKYYTERDIARYTNKGKYSFLSAIGVYHSDYYIFVKNDDVLGCIVVRKKLTRKLRMECWIYDVFIIPKYRGLGLGKELLNNALALCDSSAVYLSVSKDNVVAINLYKRIGFYQYGTHKNELIMRYDKL